MSLDFTLDLHTTLEDGTRGPDYNTFDGNVTHNLTGMWSEAGIYDVLYNTEGEQIGIYLDKLASALEDMRRYPDKYKEHSPINGWGTYEGAIRFLEALVKSAQEWPQARIHIWK